MTGQPHIPQHPRHGQGGFTLIEVLVSTVILAIGILASVGFIVATIDGNKRAQQLTTATVLASEKLEQIQGAIKTRDDWDAYILPAAAANWVYEYYPDIPRGYQRTLHVVVGHNSFTHTSDYMALLMVQVKWRDRNDTWHQIWEYQYFSRPPGPATPPDAV